MIADHPAKLLPSRKNIFEVELMKNCLFEIRISKTISKLMKAPYQTNCIDYVTDSYYSRFRTADECKNVCIKDYSYEANSCATYHSVLTSVRMFDDDQHRNQKICPDEVSILV